MTEEVREPATSATSQQLTSVKAEGRLSRLRNILRRFEKRRPENNQRIKQGAKKLDEANTRLNEVTGSVGMEELKPFLRFREQMHNQALEDVKRRLLENPIPTEDKGRAGVFKEAIESQCRDAIFAMRAKGYSTLDSGFNAHKPVDQIVTFNEEIDNGTVQSLREMGVYYGHFEPMDINYLVFRAKNADFDLIKQKWDGVVSFLPDLGKSAEDGRRADEFRRDPIGETKVLYNV